MAAKRTKNPNDYPEVIARFLEDHNKVIDSLGFTKKERTPELRKPVRDPRTHSAPDIAKIEGKLGFELPLPLAKFLREVGSLWLYDYEIFPTGNLAKEIKDFKSWIKEDPMTVIPKQGTLPPKDADGHVIAETVMSDDLLPFAGYDLDKYLIHLETKKVFFWNHEEWSKLQTIGTFDQWLSSFLMERLQGVKSYYRK